MEDLQIAKISTNLHLPPVSQIKFTNVNLNKIQTKHNPQIKPLIYENVFVLQ